VSVAIGDPPEMMWEAGDGSAARGQILWGGREFLRATPCGAVRGYDFELVSRGRVMM